MPLNPSTLPSNSSLPIPGRLRESWLEWQKLNPSSFVASVILHGFRLSWKDGVSPPCIHRQNSHAALEKAPFVDTCIQDLMHKGVIRRCSPSEAWCVLAVKVLPKPHSTKMRFILDGSPLKPFELTRQFKLKHLWTEGRELFADCNYGGLIDLSDAYYHIELHPDSRKFVAFCWRHQYYLFCSLPMGIHSAPFVFTRVNQPNLDGLHGRFYLRSPGKAYTTSKHSVHV